MDTIPILIVDDVPLFRHGVRAAVKEACGVYGGGRGGRRNARPVLNALGRSYRERAELPGR